MEPLVDSVKKQVIEKYQNNILVNCNFMFVIRTNYHNICPRLSNAIVYFSSDRLITLLYLSSKTSNQRIESRYHCFQTSSALSSSSATPSTSPTCRCSAACWRDFGFSSFFSTPRLPQGQYSDHDVPQEDDDDSQENDVKNVHLS